MCWVGVVLAKSFLLNSFLRLILIPFRCHVVNIACCLFCFFFHAAQDDTCDYLLLILYPILQVVLTLVEV